MHRKGRATEGGFPFLPWILYNTLFILKTMTKGPIHGFRSFLDWPILEEVSTMYTTSPTS